MWFLYIRARRCARMFFVAVIGTGVYKVLSCHFCTCRVYLGTYFAILAQLVERHIRNVQVIGSIPMDGS